VDPVHTNIPPVTDFVRFETGNPKGKHENTLDNSTRFQSNKAKASGVDAS
jgi:hypothetical protein